LFETTLMIALARINTFLFDLILVVTLLVVLLLMIRAVINFRNVNPFSRWVMVVRRWTDPLVEPVRRLLMPYRVSYKVAPFICMGIVLLLGYVTTQFLSGVYETIRGVSIALRMNNLVAAAGFLLYGLLALYSALLIFRIIIMWGRTYHRSRWLRRLEAITDPILLPLRRLIPPVRMIDLSPLVALLAIWVLQQIVVATMLRGVLLG
jgi:YggT family protein